MFLDSGKLLASLSSEEGGRRQLLVWDVKNATVRPEWTPPEKEFQAVIPGQSGRTAVAFVNNFATVWHRQDGSWVAGRPIDVVNPRPGFTISPDEDYLLVPVWPRYLHIYRLRDGVLANVLKDHGGGVNCIAFSPGGDMIATSSDDSSVCVFEFPSGKLLHRFFGHVWGAVWQVAWSPSGDSLASVGNDGMVRVWDIEHGSLRRHLSLPEPRSRATRGPWGRSQLLETGLWGFAFLQDGMHLNGVYHDGLNLTWDLTVAPPKLSAEYLGQRATPIATMPAAAGSVLAHWDSRAYRIPNRYAWVDNDFPQNLNGCVRFTDDGSQIIDLARGQLRKWNVSPFQLIDDQRNEQLNRPDLIADVSPDGSLFCAANLGGDVSIYGLNRSGDVRLDSNGKFVTACFSSTGDRILLLNHFGVTEYDVDTGKRIRTFNQEAVTATTYSADAQRIAVAYESGYVCIYDALTGEETLRIDAAASELLFSRDGTSLVTDGAPDGGLYYWPGKKE
jgi:WD40 repeat protein